MLHAFHTFNTNPATGIPFLALLVLIVTCARLYHYVDESPTFSNCHKGREAHERVRAHKEGKQ